MVTKYNPTLKMYDTPRGEFVHLSDYEAAIEKIARLEAELDSLRSYAHEATNAITGLTIGGSEYFGQKIWDIYTADLPFCIKRIRERFYASHNAKCAEIVAQRRAEAVEAERDDLKASFEARIQQMSENFRAVNIARVIEATGADIYALQERTLAAEAQLAKEKAENKGLREVLLAAHNMIENTAFEAGTPAELASAVNGMIVAALKSQPETDGRV